MPAAKTESTMAFGTSRSGFWTSSHIAATLGDSQYPLHYLTGLYIQSLTFHNLSMYLYFISN